MQIVFRVQIDGASVVRDGLLQIPARCGAVSQADMKQGNLWIGANGGSEELVSIIVVILVNQKAPALSMISGKSSVSAESFVSSKNSTIASSTRPY